jgi:hypothetical protein
MVIQNEAPDRPRIGARPNKKERRYVENDGMRDVRCVDNLKLSAWARNNSRVDAENLPAARYGIISGAKNTITTVILAVAPLSSLERFDRRRRRIQRCARSGSRAKGHAGAARAHCRLMGEVKERNNSVNKSDDRIRTARSGYNLVDALHRETSYPISWLGAEIRACACLRL